MFFIYAPIYGVASGLDEMASATMVSMGAASMFLVPMWGWWAAATAAPPAGGGYTLTGVMSMAVTAADAGPWLGPVSLVAAALAAGIIDGAGNVPFLRAVHPHQRPEMTGVFLTYRGVAQLVSPGIFALVLKVFAVLAVPAVFLVGGAMMLAGPIFRASFRAACDRQAGAGPGGNGTFTVRSVTPIRISPYSNLLPSRPARSEMNCQATRPERAPRVTAHSLACAPRSPAGASRAVVGGVALDHGHEGRLVAGVEAEPEAEAVRQGHLLLGGLGRGDGGGALVLDHVPGHHVTAVRRGVEDDVRGPALYAALEHGLQGLVRGLPPFEGKVVAEQQAAAG